MKYSTGKPFGPEVTSPYLPKPRVQEIHRERVYRGGERFYLNLSGVQPINAPKGPVALKAVFTGRVAVNGRNYYVPIFPCMTDFSLVPAIEIPESQTVVDIAPSQSLMALYENSGCNGATTYTFSAPPTPTSVETYLSMIMR